MHRSLELLITTLMLAVLSPLLAIVAALVFLAMGRPILFRQQRIGRDGRAFDIVKFRTMRTGTGGPVDTSSDAARLTWIGRLLRATSLDELPELFNVLRGDMALVGPRPLLPEYLELYDDTQARRHEVRPGITGWAQVNGRNTVDWQDRFRLDVWYVDNRSLLLDVRILLMTIGQVFRTSEVSQQGRATQDKFTGNAT